jgi:HlyD family secretion protein
MVLDKQRERIEKQQELKSQEFIAASLQAAISQSDRKMAQIQSSYRQKLQADKVETYAAVQKLEQELAKQHHKRNLLELKSPQAGIVKDLATHTPGTVVQPGTVLMTLVPQNEALQAEVWVNNQDAGFVRSGQQVQLKLATYPFQKYGMIAGEVIHVGADSSDAPKTPQQPEDADNAQPAQRLAYRALITIEKQYLEVEGTQLELTPGMQLAAEIKLSSQTVMEYLLSPVRKAFMEAGRER